MKMESLACGEVDGNIIFSGLFNDLPLCIRRATHADYDDVLKIEENIYGGRDYMPSTYHDMLDDQTAHPFVMETDGKVIAFICTWIDGLDNTVTMTTSARVSVSYRHKGLFQFIGKMVRNEMNKNFPNLQYDWTFSIADGKVIKAHVEGVGQLVEKKPILSVTMCIDDLLKDGSPMNAVVDVSSPSESELIELLRQPGAMDYLFPNGIFIHADRLMPVPAKEYFIRKVISKGSTNISGTLQSQNFSLSFVFWFKCALGVQIFICYYGSPDGSIVKAHLMKAVNDLSNTSLMKTLKQDNVRQRDVTTPGTVTSKLAKLSLYFLLTSSVDTKDMSEFFKTTFNLCADTVWCTDTVIYKRSYK